MYCWYERVYSAHCRKMLYSGILRLDQYNGYMECHLLWNQFHAWYTVGVSYPPYWVSRGHYGIGVCSIIENMGSNNQWKNQWLVHPWQILGNSWRDSQCSIYQTIRRKINNSQVLSYLHGNQFLILDHPEAHPLNLISLQPRLIYAHFTDMIHYIYPQVK